MTAVVCASGPSLTPDDVNQARGRAVVIVVNTTFRLAPWADHLYACDAKWWQQYHSEVSQAFTGQCWTICAASARKYRIHHIESAGRGGGLCKTPGKIYHGGNSGYQAIGLAHQLGHKRIILLGFDCQESRGQKHWHGDHPGSLNRPQAFKTWAQRFEALAKNAPNHGVEIINCSRETSLTCFPRMSLESALAQRPIHEPCIRHPARSAGISA